MKERPILFSSQMVRAILDGSKTQTRRICKPAETLSYVIPCQDPATFAQGQQSPAVTPGWFGDEEGDVQFFCPYGKPGDRLWVRETWARDDEDGALMYRADIGHGGDADAWEIGRNEGVARFKWRPSIHMPRSACRITLEVVSVRVERLQAISEADAIAEGASDYQEGVDAPPPDDDVEWCWSYRAAYSRLWDQINGAGAWDANPWVWCVEFKRVQPCR